ncbi:MAG: trypsin-like peptidase domain-containing protein [Buchananella hordeovulneris]|nr:trypsin-like peptidase domain-containing protein [Buchananella hordeovulneris]
MENSTHGQNAFDPSRARGAGSPQWALPTGHSLASPSGPAQGGGAPAGAWPAAGGQQLADGGLVLPGPAFSAGTGADPAAPGVRTEEPTLPAPGPFVTPTLAARAAQPAAPVASPYAAPARPAPRPPAVPASPAAAASPRAASAGDQTATSPQGVSVSGGVFAAAGLRQAQSAHLHTSAPAHAGAHAAEKTQPGWRAAALASQTSPLSSPQFARDANELPAPYFPAAHSSFSAPAHSAADPAPDLYSASQTPWQSPAAARASFAPLANEQQLRSRAGRTKRRRQPTWAGVVGVALACSLAASVGSIAVMSQLASESSPPFPAPAANVAPVVTSAGEAPNWQAVQAAVGNSVVSIELRSETGGSSGSGVIIDKEGHIVTNHHVVAGAPDGKVSVALADGRIYGGKVVGSDSATDLAVVKLENAPADLAVATLGTSQELYVGQSVAAIGNPLGYASTMTTGIISALDRPVSTEQEQATGDASSAFSVTNAIQIDASINPGNSGGPLFDAAGRVIGINSSIATVSATEERAGSIGLGFAIPVDLVKLIVDQIMGAGGVQHAFLGVSLGDAQVEIDGAGYLGAEVKEVTPASAAEEAGVKAGDVILSFNGKKISSVEGLMASVREVPVGAKVELELLRGTERVKLSATLKTRDENA